MVGAMRLFIKQSRFWIVSQFEELMPTVPLWKVNNNDSGLHTEIATNGQRGASAYGMPQNISVLAAGLRAPGLFRWQSR